jgi:hypothetical protein
MTTDRLDRWLGAQVAGTPAETIYTGPVISVTNGLAIVERWQPAEDRRATLQAARNWQELEARAMGAVTDAGKDRQKGRDRVKPPDHLCADCGSDQL